LATGLIWPKRIAHAKELLASYEKEKGKIDWQKIKGAVCASNIKSPVRMGQIMQQLLRRSTSTSNSADDLEPSSVVMRSLGELTWMRLPGGGDEF